MKPLKPPDSFHLQAAEGWCELDAPAEAAAELDKILASLRAHPLVLEARWLVYANLEKWDCALDIAIAIVKRAPDWENGWVYQANSLKGLNRHQEAYDTLSEVASRFPSSIVIPFELACLGADLNRREDVCTWFCKAVREVGNRIRETGVGPPRTQRRTRRRSR